MPGLNGNLFQRLRARIRDFEDRKISAADLSREIFHIAREIDAEGEPLLRRRLEMFGNQVSAVISQDFAEPTPRVLKLVDQIESELVEWGY